MNQITATELKEKIENKDDFQLIDIREEYELELVSIGGEHIPMGEIVDNLDKIRKDIPVVMMCRTGTRTCKMINYLEDQFDNLVNLQGGIMAWVDEIDPSLTKY